MAAVSDDHLTRSGRRVIGVDLGGTKLAVGLVDERLALLGEAISPTVTDSAEACLTDLYERLGAALERFAPVDAVGVGAPSMVDFASGRLIDSVNLPLADLPLRDLLRDRFGLPVALDNDANVACLAEHRFGAGRGASEMIMLTVGTGVGGGIITRGALYRGASGAAGELGHMSIAFDGPPNGGGCPNFGCLETYASGRAIAERAERMADDEPASALARTRAGGERLGGEVVTRLAIAGDPRARAVLAEIGRFLGIGIASYVNIFNPEVVVIGGGCSAAGDLLLEPARRVVAERALRPQREQVRIVQALFGREAGIVGAAALAVSELFQDGAE